MPLENYRDIGSSGADFDAGFQFEFSCAGCGRTWKSEFKPYRMGQISGLFSRFFWLVSNSRTVDVTARNVAGLGTRGAKQKALERAQEQAQALYTPCPRCHKAMCADCLDPEREACESCLQTQRLQQEEQARTREQDARQAQELACPNCHTPHGGGRFCAACGFDLASTHKACPACGATQARDARFCTGCGHGF